MNGLRGALGGVELADAGPDTCTDHTAQGTLSVTAEEATDLRIELVVEDEAAELRLRGELDLGNAGRLRAIFVGLSHAGLAVVTVDMEGVGFVDSTSVGVLIQAKKRLEEAGTEMIISATSSRVRRTLDVAGVDEFLGIG